MGADGGMETRLVPREGYEIRTVTITTSAPLSPAGVRHNLKTLANLELLPKAGCGSWTGSAPICVVGTGGYASFPRGAEVTRRGIATAVHESNACPGLTTKMLSKYVDRVRGFEASWQYYPHPDRVVVTGTRCGRFLRSPGRRPGKAGHHG